MKAIFMHIQKTAGTAMVLPMFEFYGRENSVSHGDHFYQLNEQTLEIKFFENKELVEKYHALPFISGHFGFDFCKQFMANRYSFTFLRNPEERIVSYYYFCKARNSDEFYEYSVARKVSLETFLEMGLEDPSISVRIWNNQTWSLAHGNFAKINKKSNQFTEQQLLQMAIENLNKFSYIGLVDSFEFDQKNIYDALGISFLGQTDIINMTPGRPKVNNLPHSTQVLLRKLTELDWELYRAVLSNKEKHSA